MSRTTVERFGRIWATTETPAPRQYLTHSLFVPYGWQARISLAAGHVCAQERRHLDLVDGSPDRVRFAPVIAALSSLSTANPVQWIFIEAPDGEQTRCTVFLFARATEQQPFAVLKVRHMDGPGASLGHERDTLEHIGRGPLRAIVPVHCGLTESGEWEILAMEPVTGVSMYREMKTALAPSTRIEEHFRRAMGWLERFHAAEPRAAHGDFWARNILINGAHTAVVDWEHFAEHGDPLSDVFHFPLTYALAYRGAGFDRLAPIERFHRAFCGSGRLAHTVAGWFKTIAHARGLRLDLLRRRFLDHLDDGAEGRIRRPRLSTTEWRAIRDRCRGATQGAFAS